MKNVLALGLLLSISVQASAAVSEKYKEWRNGPAQWIMTSEEMKAWKALQTDEQASDFIDLFWVRRDPTKGTPKNEYRDEFLARVKGSDAEFSEGRRKGSMTDRGRVFIVLGNPTIGGLEVSANTHHAIGDMNLGTDGGNRERGGRITWMWIKEDAAKYDMPQIEVLFIEEPGTRKVQRDPRRADFMGAAPVAIRKAIVNPELTSVPDWAARGGLQPKYMVTVAPPVTVPAPAPPVPASADGAPAVAAPAVAGTPALPGTAPAPAGGAVASRLTLLKDVWSVNSELRTDPFTKITPIGTFKAEDDLGWIAQYCSGSDDEPTVVYSLRLTGTAGNEIIDRAAPPDELVPDRIKVAPGCYLMRGMIPLEGMSAGNYALELSVEDPATKTNQALKQDFLIE